MKSLIDQLCNAIISKGEALQYKTTAMPAEEQTDDESAAYKRDKRDFFRPLAPPGGDRPQWEPIPLLDRKKYVEEVTALERFNLGAMQKDPRLANEYRDRVKKLQETAASDVKPFLPHLIDESDRPLYARSASALKKYWHGKISSRNSLETRLSGIRRKAETLAKDVQKLQQKSARGKRRGDTSFMRKLEQKKRELARTKGTLQQIKSRLQALPSIQEMRKRADVSVPLAVNIDAPPDKSRFEPMTDIQHAAALHGSDHSTGGESSSEEEAKLDFELPPDLTEAVTQSEIDSALRNPKDVQKKLDKLRKKTSSERKKVEKQQGKLSKFERTSITNKQLLALNNAINTATAPGSKQQERNQLLQTVTDMLPPNSPFDKRKATPKPMRWGKLHQQQLEKAKLDINNVLL